MREFLSVFGWLFETPLAWLGISLRRDYETPARLGGGGPRVQARPERVEEPATVAEPEYFVGEASQQSEPALMRGILDASEQEVIGVDGALSAGATERRSPVSVDLWADQELFGAPAGDAEEPEYEVRALAVGRSDETIEALSEPDSEEGAVEVRAVHFEAAPVFAPFDPFAIQPGELLVDPPWPVDEEAMDTLVGDLDDVDLGEFDLDPDESMLDTVVGELVLPAEEEQTLDMGRGLAVSPTPVPIEELVAEAQDHAASAELLGIEAEATTNALTDVIEQDPALTPAVLPSLKRARFAAGWVEKAASRARAAATQAAAAESRIDAMAAVDDALAALEDARTASLRVAKEDRRARRALPGEVSADA